MESNLWKYGSRILNIFSGEVLWILICITVMLIYRCCLGRMTFWIRTIIWKILALYIQRILYMAIYLLLVFPTAFFLTGKKHFNYAFSDHALNIRFKSLCYSIELLLKHLVTWSQSCWMLFFYWKSFLLIVTPLFECWIVVLNLHNLKKSIENIIHHFTIKDINNWEIPKNWYVSEQSVCYCEKISCWKINLVLIYDYYNSWKASPSGAKLPISYLLSNCINCMHPSIIIVTTNY